MCTPRCSIFCCSSSLAACTLGTAAAADTPTATAPTAAAPTAAAPTCRHETDSRACMRDLARRVIKFAKLHLAQKPAALLLLLRWSLSAAMQAAGSSVGSKEQDEIELLQQREVTVCRGKQPEDEYKLMFFDLEGVGWVVSAQQANMAGSPTIIWQGAPP